MTEEEKTKTINLTLPIIIILLMAASFLAGLFLDKIREEKSGEQKQIAQATPTPKQPAVLAEQLESANVGRFVKTEDEICREDGKPIVYMFGSSGCSFCIWEHPIFEKATAKFGDLIAVHDNMGKQGTDEEIWQKYGQIHQGGVPFMLLGCRYAQRGAGDRNLGEDREEENITALICKLTDNQPEKICDKVKDLVDQIEN